MRVKPILFNTEMVRAILDGGKTATRRIIKPQPKDRIIPEEEFHARGGGLGFIVGAIPDKKYIKKCAPYQPGDVMYVRETWVSAYDGEAYFYLADKCTNREQKKLLDYDDVKWRPSIHMPKEAARIWLKVTDVRVERLQDMMMSDMRAEGMVPPEVTGGQWQQWQLDYAKPAWDSTIKKSDIDKYGWEANPRVRVIEFERCEKPESEEEENERDFI